MKQLKKSKRPVVRTVKRKAAAIAYGAEAYQPLLDMADQDALEGIRPGLEDVNDGKVRPARQVGGGAPSLETGPRHRSTA